MFMERASPNRNAFRLRSREVSRIEAFSDVVFGFALTLLVVSLEVPHTFTELLADMRGFLPFAICFAVFGQVWWLHHQFFRRYGLDDGITAALNFGLLFVMLLYVYPLKFLFTGLFNQLLGHPYHGAGGEPWIAQYQAGTLMIIYGAGYATVFLLFILLHWHALRKRRELDLNSFELFDTYTSMTENCFHALVGVLCALTAAILPANISGLAGYVFFLIPIGMTIIGSRRGAARRELETIPAGSAPPS
jgi:uncharacterized membrane protein